MATLLALCCCLSVVSGQWLEKTIGFADSFGSTRPAAIYYVPNTDFVYAAGEDGIIVIDAATNVRMARMDLKSPLFMAYDSHDNRVYMGSGDDSLTVIDPVTNHVMSRVRVGSYPYKVCYNPTANKVYCLTGSNLDTLAVVDCNTNSVRARIWVGWNEYPFSSICCNPAGNKVYVSSFETGTIAVIDGPGDSLLKSLTVGDYPVAPTYSSISNKLYCAVFESTKVAIFDAGPDTLLGLINLTTWPIALGYNPVSNKVYIGDCDGYIHIIDSHTDAVLASLGPASGEPRSFLFDSVDNRVFCFPDYYTSILVMSGSGDTIVGSVALIGDADDPDPACFDPQHDRVYIRGRTSADVTVVDPASCEPVEAVPMDPAPTLGCYAEPMDKLYCSDEESGLITVINCSTDSLERRIFTPAWGLGQPVYTSGSNKLFCSASLSDGRALLVVNCARDSFEAALPMNVDGAAAIVYNPAMDRLYWARAWIDSTIAVVDCERDSLVTDVQVGGYPTALACSPDSNRIYCARYSGDSTYISAIDCAADSVIGTVCVLARSTTPRAMGYVPSRDIVCCAAGSSIVAVDGTAKHVLGQVDLGGSTSELCVDRASSKLYCLVGRSDMAVVDCRDMSLKATIRLAAGPSGMAFDTIADRVYVTSPDFGCMTLLDGRTNRLLGIIDAGTSPGDITWVPQHRRMYVVDQKEQSILVFKDTSFASLSGVSARRPFRTMPTVVSNVLLLPEATSPRPQATSLLDISGRKVMSLLPGANNVRALAPGVYFVREQSAVSSQHSGAASVRKVVVTR